MAQDEEPQGTVPGNGASSEVTPVPAPPTESELIRQEVQFLAHHIGIRAKVEPLALAGLSQRFKDLPVIQSMAIKVYTINSFLDKVAGLILVTAGVLTGFAVIIAVGVVYTSARIALQERAWELASLRVLGFTRAEVAHILLGQFVVEIGIAIPIGLALSHGIVHLIARFHSNESFQIPAVIGLRTYVAAAVIVVAAAAASAYGVRRRIDYLDLVAVLKTRD